MDEETRIKIHLQAILVRKEIEDVLQNCTDSKHVFANYDKEKTRKLMDDLEYLLELMKVLKRK